MQTERLQTLVQVRSFLVGNEPSEFRIPDRDTAYEFVRRVLVRFRYLGLSKADKGSIKQFLAKVTGLSQAQLTRLIRQYRDTGRVQDQRRKGPAPLHCSRHRPARRGRRPAGDTLRPHHQEALRARLPGLRGRLLRAPGEDLQRPSLQTAHGEGYRRQRATIEKTRSVRINIGERKKAPARRAPRLPARRHRPPGRLRRQERPVSHQPDRRGHPVRVRRQRRPDQRSLPPPRDSRPDRRLPLRHPRRPYRQRQHIRQPPGRRHAP